MPYNAQFGQGPEARPAPSAHLRQKREETPRAVPGTGRPHYCPLAPGARNAGERSNPAEPGAVSPSLRELRSRGQRRHIVESDTTRGGVGSILRPHQPGAAAGTRAGPSGRGEGQGNLEFKPFVTYQQQALMAVHLVAGAKLSLLLATWTLLAHSADLKCESERQRTWPHSPGRATLSGATTTATLPLPMLSLLALEEKRSYRAG